MFMSNQEQKLRISEWLYKWIMVSKKLMETFTQLQLKIPQSTLFSLMRKMVTSLNKIHLVSQRFQDYLSPAYNKMMSSRDTML